MLVRHLAQRRWLSIALALVLSGCSSARKPSTTAGNDGELRLAPDPAFAGARITVTFTDPNIRAERCRFEWRRNGAVIPVAVTDGLEPGQFGKGDEVEVVATVPGTEPGSERQLRAAVRVANTAPTVMRVTVLPSTDSSRAVIQATVEGLDQDGDPLTFSYRWFQNGAAIASAAGPNLQLSKLDLNAQIAVEVVANDGEDESPPARGEVMRIENRPPVFVSQPTAPGSADSVFRYQAVANDPDGDPVRYQLVSGPAGIIVDTGGGVVWAVPASARGGEHAIAIRAIDSKGGEATQQFSIRMAAPVAKR